MTSSVSSSARSNPGNTLRSAIGASLFSAATALGVLVPGSATVMAEPVMSKEILSVQVRKQGFPCERPTHAAKDVERSTPGSAMWLLVCDSGSYRVRLVPKMAAEVELVK